MLKKIKKANQNYINYPQGEKNSDIFQWQIKKTRWLFFALCFYLISQGFTIPILPIGPWATWPNFSDLGVLLIVLTFLLNINQKNLLASSSNQQLIKILIVILVLSIWSHLGYLSNLVDGDAFGIKLGIYQIYRLVQFVCIFWATSKIPLTTERIKLLKQITTFILIFVCLSILLTFSGIFPMGLLIAHLPQSLDGSGPWYYYVLAEKAGGKGWGTIGYNHAYVAVQVVMLVTLRIHLAQGKQVILNFCLLLLSLICCFFSESRAGFFTILIFATIYMLKKPAYTGILITITAVIFISFGFVLSSPNISLVGLNATESSVLERQSTILDASNADNLSGRDEIWQERLNFLSKEPMLSITGIGFGAAWDYWGSGESAHMLPLHVIIENGILGLFIFCFLFYKILYLLYKYEIAEKAIFWSTIGLLLSSSTQETFYPVPAFGHFLGLYLCSVAIALRNSETNKLKNMKII
ncbi:O-antigen ligase family protein [Nostoc sp. UIC 10607]|uniref:O-antigen ligase family protein n=1 Tax=Nostoc sp. UIC 10607 TaxID=3045935 RepID=UPI0039A2AA50